uniref:Uncharacterized protein n=1 Tax=Anguilla anguilla TaxID=7936 RepID=A0A0E9T9H8_ANGAN
MFDKQRLPAKHKKSSVEKEKIVPERREHFQ